MRRMPSARLTGRTYSSRSRWGSAPTWWRPSVCRSNKFTGAEFDVAPLSVVIDPVRALRVLGIEPGAKFSGNVIYIYKKQLEEAGVIVVNKADLVSADRLGRLQDALLAEFPDAKQCVVRARRHGTRSLVRIYNDAKGECDPRDGHRLRALR